MSLLQADRVTKRFGGLVAVSEVSFQLEPGMIASIIGPNGAGKTTFFNMLTGIYRPDGGTLRFAGRDIAGAPPDRILTYGVARTFQNIRLFANLTAVENVLVGMHAHLRARLFDVLFQTRASRREEAEALERAFELLEYVRLTQQANEIAKNLPYGDQRRLEIARALAARPRLLLLDEPTAGMNPAETRSTCELIQRLRDERGITVLLIEHDMQVVMGISDRVTVLDYGIKIAEGTPAEVRRDPRVIEAYLGRGAAAALGGTA